MKNEFMLYVFIAFCACAFLFWVGRGIHRNISDRKIWNWGKCTKCEDGYYKRLASASKKECGGLWYRCNKCSYSIFLKYYDPSKDICW